MTPQRALLITAGAVASAVLLLSQTACGPKGDAPAPASTIVANGGSAAPVAGNIPANGSQPTATPAKPAAPAVCNASTAAQFIADNSAAAIVKGGLQDQSGFWDALDNVGIGGSSRIGQLMPPIGNPANGNQVVSGLICPNGTVWAKTGKKPVLTNAEFITNLADGNTGEVKNTQNGNVQKTFYRQPAAKILNGNPCPALVYTLDVQPGYTLVQAVCLTGLYPVWTG